jgi:zinc and cadmium transporter
MIFEALIAAVAISLISLIGVFFFGHDKRLIGIERYAIPAAVGVFLSLALIDLIPETIESASTLGGIVIGIGFISFYILSNILHKRFHNHEDEDCDKKGAAMLVLIGDAIHNLSDGFILGGAFLISPAAGVGVAIGLALHEAPQEIVEFGVLLRAGYTRTKAALLNLLSASSIIVGTLIILVLAKQAEDYVWVLSAFAAGNLLYLAASELLPRIHGEAKQYGSAWRSTSAIVIGFIIMTSVIIIAHEHTGAENHTEEIH